MIVIEPNALYSRQDLIAAFKPLGINWDQLNQRIKPVKRMRMALLGSDLIEALRTAPVMRSDDANEYQPEESSEQVLDRIASATT